MKKLIFLLSFLFFSFFLFLPREALAKWEPLPLVYAQDTGWRITSFDSDIQVQSSGIVAIKETIIVDFGDLEKHGIYRDIPYAYEKGDGSMYYTEVAVSSISQDEQNATYKVYKNGSYLRIQIGDADKTISGLHTYVISYNAKGILQKFEGVDELYWNVTGDQWGVPIDAVTAIVTLPRSGIVQLACYEGIVGSKAECNATKITDTIATFITTRPLGPFEEMTIAVGYTSGMVPILTVERPKDLWEKLLEPGSLLLTISLLLSGILGIIWLWFLKGRDISMPGAHETLVVEFTPPEKLKPAELGILMDEKADTLDVTATIIDLVSRGYMTITEIPKKWLFGSTDYELKKLEKTDTDLVSYEKMLLKRIFGTETTKKVSSLKNDFYDDLAKVKTEMYRHMMEKGVFVEHPESIRNRYISIAIAILVVGIVGCVFGSINEYVFVVSASAALIPLGIFLLSIATIMPRKTAKGRELYQRVKGYREFINTAEKYRQRFFEKEHLFQEVLPYAIVFGLTGKFADAMKEIGLKNTQMTGYYGIHPFNPHTFTNDINTFSNSFSSAAASTPSSSGSGGGGSSGGGFGGGGGGSW